MSRYQLPSNRLAQNQARPSAPPAFNDSPHEHARYQPRHGGREPTMRCSDCGIEIPMSSLDQHHCQRTAEPPRREALRVDVQAAGRQATYGQSLSARSPMIPTSHLDPTPPLTPNSRPSSPAGYIQGEDLARSPSNLSSTSSTNGRTPFFEKYKNLVGNNGNFAGIGTSSITRSAPSANLAAPVPGRGPPSPSWTPSSSSPTSFSNSPRSRTPPPPPSQALQQQRPSGSQNGSVGGPASNRSNTPPRSRKVSGHERPLDIEDAYSGLSELSYDYDKEDNRRTITASQSTPAQLASYAPSDPSIQPRRPQQPPPLRSPQPNGSSHSLAPTFASAGDRTASARPAMSRSATGGSTASDLEACLEDLRIMTEADAKEGGGYLDQPGPTRDDRMPSPSRDYRSPSPRSPSIPYSQSSPSLHSPANTSTNAASFNRAAERLATAPATQEMEERCTTCRKVVNSKERQKGGDGHIFCRDCYAERYLPRCRRCEKVIEGGAVTSSDGKIAGKYHRECFTCSTCSRSFDGTEFYVFNAKPYCQVDWHRLNGSLCASSTCGRPIEGPCVSLVGEENGGGGRYHPEHFVCSVPTCAEPLMDSHYVVGGLPYCERHSQGPPAPTRPMYPGSQEPATTRARKRQTIITRR